MMWMEGRTYRPDLMSYISSYHVLMPYISSQGTVPVPIKGENVIMLLLFDHDSTGAWAYVENNTDWMF